MGEFPEGNEAILKVLALVPMVPSYEEFSAAQMQGLISAADAHVWVLYQLMPADIRTSFDAMRAKVVSTCRRLIRQIGRVDMLGPRQTRKVMELAMAGGRLAPVGALGALLFARAMHTELAMARASSSQTCLAADLAIAAHSLWVHL